MPAEMTKEEVVRLGQELYDRDIRPNVEADHRGQFLVVDVASGKYEIADTVLAASDLARQNNPDARLYAVRIGYPAMYRIGHTFRPAS